MQQQISVDLVLWKPRLEEFPNLRGGEDFYENSERINDFLEQTPAARAAIVGVKENVMLGRPKGILLEAIAWRLWATFPDKGTCRTDVQSFLFFDYMLACLANWEVSPFGNDLKQDLARLPEKKREEHLQSFANFRKGFGDPSAFYFILLIEYLAEVERHSCDQLLPYECYRRATLRALPPDFYKVALEFIWALTVLEHGMRELTEIFKTRLLPDDYKVLLRQVREYDKAISALGVFEEEIEQRNRTPEPSWLSERWVKIKLKILKAVQASRKCFKQRSKTQRKKVLNPVAWAFKIPLGLRISVDLKDLGL